MTNAITFEQFQSEVEAWWPGAGEKGEFRNYDGELCPTYDSDRTLYEWQSFGFRCCSYDTRDEKPWMADNGRGMIGRGMTLAEADADEKQEYDACF